MIGVHLDVEREQLVLAVHRVLFVVLAETLALLLAVALALLCAIAISLAFSGFERG